MTHVVDSQRRSRIALEAQKSQSFGVVPEVEVDAEALAAELHQRIRGEVRFDNSSRALYSTDSSNYRQIPIGVVVPKDAADVETTVELCRRYKAPITSRGGGTALAGQTCNMAVILDFSKYMNKVLWVDAEKKLARVQAGCILDDLQIEARKHGLRFGPDPATHSHCTLGGMIGNNSCGIHSVLSEFYGPGARTSDNLESLEILTFDGLRMEVGPTSSGELEEIIAEGGRRGEIYRKLKELGKRNADLMRDRYPQIPRRVSGYENLDEFIPGNDFNVARALAGTEGTCAIMLEATVKLIETPKETAILVLGYPDIFAAGQHIPLIREHKPIGLEGMDGLLISYQEKKHMYPSTLDVLPEGTGFLLVEFGADTEDEAVQKTQRLMDALDSAENSPSMKIFGDHREEERLWQVREAGLGATARIPNKPDTWPGWEDTAVPPEDIGDYLRDLRALFNKYGYEAALYGHFGQGLVHCRVTFDLRTAEGLAKYRTFLDEATDLVVRYGGTISGEHGDGQARGELLVKMYGEEMMSVFREFKTIWDPQWRLNPGKVIDADPVVANLRLGADYQPWEPETEFQYPDDDFSFARASLRCVGVGKCRREGSDGGVMCPSYMVTREEKHSTRGRARLLFEMLMGDAIHDGWRSEEVKEALDLCLACKGCKTDCPVNVDMATYKAEFNAHYYAGRPRPRTGYTMGLIYWWARLAAKMPGLVNLVTQTPGISTLFKTMGGIAPKRRIPKFAPQTFKDWLAQRPSRQVDGPQVMLWPDTFNNFLHPEVAVAAVEVLEAAGFSVTVPQMSLCCGRPLYDYGFLDQAKDLLQETIAALRPQIRMGTPIVGLEPSCVAVFRDELHNLYPHDEDAKRLHEQVFTVGEFLERYASDFQIPRLERKALVHVHCHHHAIMGTDTEVKVLDKLGLDYDFIDSGCCGMAGSFGFEHDKYDVSVAAGERALLPAVRGAPQDTLIITDGFSCREQIEQLSNRRPLHLVQVVQMALRQGPEGPHSFYPEDVYYAQFTPKDGGGAAALRTTLMGAAGALAGGLVAWGIQQIVTRREGAPTKEKIRDS